MLIVAFPRTPLRGTRTCWILQHFRRAKSERLPAFYSGPLGPDCSRIAAVAVPPSRLAWSSQRFRSVSRRRGGYQPPECLLPSREKVPSACEADEGGLLRCCTSPAGGPRASPTQFRKTFLKPVGEGLAPPALGGFRPSAGRPVSGPYERTGRLCVRRRGG